MALKLRSEQATCHFFCDVAGVLSTVAQACASPGVCPQLQRESQQNLQAFALSVAAHLLCCRKQGLACIRNAFPHTHVSEPMHNGARIAGSCTWLILGFYRDECQRRHSLALCDGLPFFRRPFSQSWAFYILQHRHCCPQRQFVLYHMTSYVNNFLVHLA